MKTILPQNASVDLRKLRFDLCGNENKLPAGFAGEFPVTLYSRRRYADGVQRPLGQWHLIVRPTEKTGRKTSKHRIFALVDGREIPVGRLAQARSKHQNIPHHYSLIF